MRDLLEVYESATLASRMAELHELVQPTLEELASTLDYRRAFVVLLDEQRGTLEEAVGVNVPDEILAKIRARLEEAPGPLVQAFQSGKPLHVDDALRDPRIPEGRRSYYADAGLLAFAAIPLLPASAVLVVSKDHPVTDADMSELLPYAGRIVATIAERMEAKRSLASGEQHAIEKEWLWWMANSVQDPIVLSNEQNEILLYNIHAERLLKTSPDDSPGKRRAIELNNFLLTAALSSFTLDQGRAMGRELTLVDPIEGAELLFEVICQPATNLRTGERGLVSFLKDVTDLRRAAEELNRSLESLHQAGEETRRERDRLNLILASVADPIVVTDATGQIVLMNQQAERLLQPPAQPPATGTTAYLANNAKLTSFVSQLGLEAASLRRGELEMVDPETAEPLTMSVTATEVYDELGQVTAFVSVLHDLTKIRELERRTIEQQLFESEKLAAVGRLAASVAHEINNPLEAITNALYLVLSRTPEDDPNRRFLEIANRETARVSGIIRQMLGFYRSKAAKAPTDVNQVLEETISLVERQLRQHRVVLRTELDRGLPLVPASADQLKQVFLNLILNAQEAMPEGGTLYVTTRLSRENDAEFLSGHYVLVQVRDTGTGIPEDKLPHIFEPFYSTKGETKGTGLGLWVSLGIVQNHDGQIKVRSRPGRGTTFTVALPPVTET
ncbi:MAG TPA: ATP-binding protein [Chloroflexota bacterium]|nr:ATP-binding protein [Chloroflexota bacterium]